MKIYGNWGEGSVSVVSNWFEGKHRSLCLIFTYYNNGLSITIIMLNLPTFKFHWFVSSQNQIFYNFRWPCDLCKFVGGYKADLKRHIKIVHDGFALTCDQCTFSTPHVYVLNKHKEKNHFQTWFFLLPKFLTT